MAVTMTAGDFDIVRCGSISSLVNIKAALLFVTVFAKNFSQDDGSPDFLFGWTIILFKYDRIRVYGEKPV